MGFTASVAWRAGALLDELSRGAAAALGLPGVPPDARLLEMLNEAEALYHFSVPDKVEPDSLGAAAGRPQLRGGGAGSGGLTAAS